MLDKNSLSHGPHGVSSSPEGDPVREASKLASENSSPSIHTFKSHDVNSTGNELCGNGAILGDKITDVDNNSSIDPLVGVSHTSNNFFENADDKDSSDFLYYSWPDLENFEDVDRMFRTCDSTFGLGTGKEDDVDWFSSAGNMGGSGDVINPDFDFSCPESNTLENVPPDSSKSYSFDDSVMTDTSPIRLKDSTWMSENSDSYSSFMNWPAIADDKLQFIPKSQMSEHQKQVRPQNELEGRTKEHEFVDGFVDYMNKLPSEVGQLPSRTISHQAFPSVHIQQKQDDLGSDTCSCLQNHLPYIHSDNGPLSDLTSVNPTASAIKSENNHLASPSPSDSSHASNLLPLMDGCRGKNEKLHNCRSGRSSVESSLKHANVRAALDNPVSITKEAQYIGGKSENHSDNGVGSLSIPPELGSSNVQQSSTMSSGMDDISPEVASFHQLQLVTEQLDLRTKICIRDSLYRLAQSAEQRHNHANANSTCGNGRDANGIFIADGEHSFMDIETDTNPIDRSVAHLLFHRPSESPPVPVHDSLQFNSPSKIRGSVASQPVVVEHLNKSEKAGTGRGTSDC